MESKIPKKHSAMRTAIILLLAIACILFFIYKYQTPLYKEMDAFKLIPTPQRFTELYFTNPKTLPTSITAGQLISFTFTIDNLEGVTTTYPYTAYFENSAGEVITFASSTISLSNNTSTTIPVSYVFPESGNNSNGQSKVVVNLPSLNNQEIDFLLPRTD